MEKFQGRPEPDSYVYSRLQIQRLPDRYVVCMLLTLSIFEFAASFVLVIYIDVRHSRGVTPLVTCLEYVGWIELRETVNNHTLARWTNNGWVICKDKSACKAGNLLHCDHHNNYHPRV